MYNLTVYEHSKVNTDTHSNVFAFTFTLNFTVILNHRRQCYPHFHMHLYPHTPRIMSSPSRRSPVIPTHIP